MSSYYNRSNFRYGLSEAFKKKIKEKFTKKKDIIKKSDEKRFDAEYKKNMNALFFIFTIYSKRICLNA